MAETLKRLNISPWVFDILAVISFVAIILPVFISTPQKIDVSFDGSRGIIESDHSLLVWPIRSCVTVEYTFDAINAVYLNEQGITGVGEQKFCSYPDVTTFRVISQNDIEQTYELSYRRISAIQQIIFFIVFITASTFRWWSFLMDLIISSRHSDVIKIGSTIMFGVGIGLIMIEGLLRFFFPTESLYRVAFFEPNEDIGWIHVSDLSFRWRGGSPSCIEFDVPVRFNNWGFRDDQNWTLEKRDDVVRIAILGDSHVEAIQVPFADTASEQLEQQLSDAFPNTTFQVMNFGVSNYSVGQFQLTYEHIASQFQPDIVFVYVAYFHMQRTLISRPSFGYTNAVGESLHIRPTYQLDSGGNLEFVPMEDYDAFVTVMDRITEEYGADRSIEISELTDYTSFRTLDVLRGNVTGLQLSNALSDAHPPLLTPSSDATFDALDVNYHILELLHQQVQANDAQLVFLDAFQYFDRYGSPFGSGSLIAENQAFAEEQGMSYVNLSEQFYSTAEGAQFPCDGHLNQLGNQHVADAMYAWIIANDALPD